jgi:hypothetical protein
MRLGYERRGPRVEKVLGAYDALDLHAATWFASIDAHLRINM